LGKSADLKQKAEALGESNIFGKNTSIILKGRDSIYVYKAVNGALLITNHEIPDGLISRPSYDALESEVSQLSDKLWNVVE